MDSSKGGARVNPRPSGWGVFQHPPGVWPTLERITERVDRRKIFWKNLFYCFSTHSLKIVYILYRHNCEVALLHLPYRLSGDVIKPYDQDDMSSSSHMKTRFEAKYYRSMSWPQGFRSDDVIQHDAHDV